MRKQSLTPSSLFAFFREAEKLKTTLRHSWLSTSSRQESVAEHTWMMSLLALILLPYMKTPLDEQKVLQMIIVHDLAEARTADMPVWEGVMRKEEKAAKEEVAITEIFGTLGTHNHPLLATWREYEERKVPEALFVKALDTLDVITQHNVASLETWSDNDYLWQLSKLQDGFFDSDPFLREIKDALDQWSIQKVKEVGKLDKLDQTELQKKI